MSDSLTPGAVASPPETVATYLRLRGLAPSARTLRRARRRDPADEHLPFAPGRDPHDLGDVLGALTRDQGWDPHLAREDISRTWGEVAGEGTAERTRPVGFGDGVLTIACDSTAWARELTNLRATILSEIVRRYPEAGVETLRFLGPDVPSWKWGPRTVPGRGPRDTYG